MFWVQLKYLLWKNFLLRKRQKLWAAIEIIWPLFLFLILVWVRTRDLSEKYHECHYTAKAMPSAGFLPFFQSYICTMQNPCQRYPNTDADVGVVNSKYSFLNIITEQMRIFFDSNQSVSDTERLFEDITNLVNLTKRWQPNTQPVSGNIAISSLLSDKSGFEKTAIFYGLKPIVASALVRSYLSPDFFLLVLQTVPDIMDKSKDISESLYVIQQEIFCNFTNLNKSMISTDEKTLEEIGREICAMSQTNLTSFVFEIYAYGYVSPSAVISAIANITQNVTGFQLTLKDVQQFFPILKSLQNDLNDTTPIGQLLRSLGSALSANKTSNNSKNAFFQMICGDEYYSSDSTVFRQKSSLEQMRDRFQGESSNDPRAEDANGTIIGLPRRTLDPGQGSNGGTQQIPTRKEKPSYQEDNIPLANKTMLCRYVRIDPQIETFCWDFLQSFGIPNDFLIQLFTTLRGFILVSPWSKPTADITYKLKQWLNGLDYLKRFLMDFDMNADNYQNLLNNSDLAVSFEVLSELIFNLQKVQPFLSKKNLEELLFLKTFFLNTSSSVAALPLLKNRFATMLNFTKCFRVEDRFLMLQIPNEYSLEQMGMCLSDYYLYFAGLSFDLDNSADKLSPLTTYSIRMANYLTDGTGSILDRFWNPRPRDRPFIDTKYEYYGFSFLQDSVDRAIIELQTNTSTKTGVYAQQFPNPCYQIDVFVKAIARLLPLCMSLAWVFSASLIVKNIVYEKEVRLKEFMKVMGLSNLVHWIAWFIQTFLMMLASIVLFVVIIKYGNVLKMSDPSLLLVFLILYAIAIISQCFLISTFFSKANLAAACGAFLYFMLYLPYPVMINFASQLSYSQLISGCLLAQVSFGWGCSYIAAWEDEGSGLKWSNMRYSPDAFDDFNFLTTMWMLVLDTIIYIFFTWYIEAVFPGTYGIPRPWYFPFQRSYWCGEKCRKEKMSVIEMHTQTPNDLKDMVETEPKHLPLGVSVCNLHKTYSNGKVAIRGLSLNFYENQITSFLGHNGAGKTTTISILTGLFSPSTGTVMVYGKDIRTQITEIRKSLGMCPQHNILFDILTVEEQLLFYGGLKNVPKKKLDEEVTNFLKQLGLRDKKHVFAKDLSGGMQRKLSIAVAFIGNPKTVVLDEPTAGVDPFARRGIWDLLLQHKSGRTIILSTHHMDEADLLGDRIAIISSGRLKCCGSSLFLKKRYESDYYLTIVCESKSRLPSAGNSQVNLDKQPNPNRLTPLDDKKKDKEKSDTNLKPASILPAIPTNRSAPNLLADKTNDPIYNFVLTESPGSKFVEHIGQEISFTLPSADTQLLCKFFVNLDQQLQNLAITSYGVSETKLEEIFLKADAQGADKDDDKSETTTCDKVKQYLCSKILRRRAKKATSEIVDLMDTSDEEDAKNEIAFLPGVVRPESRSRFWLLRRQAKALFIKRFINFSRNKKGAFAEIILPIVVIAITMFALSLRPRQQFYNQPPLLLTPWLYPKPNYIFHSLDNSSDLVIEDVGYRFFETMVEPPGLGCRCMSEQPLKSNGLTCQPVKGQTVFGAKSYEDVRILSDECYCSERSTYTCPTSAYSPGPPELLTNTTDYLVNMTMLNITQWIIMTERNYRKHRYGGFSLGEVNPVAGDWLNFSVIDNNVENVSDSLNKFFDSVGLNWSSVREYGTYNVEPANDTVPTNASATLQSILSGLETRSNVKVWFNNQGWAALPAYMNTMSNAMLRAFLSSNSSEYGIITYNYPMNYSKTQQAQRMAFGYNLGVELTEAVMLILAFSIVPASFVLFLIEEKTSQAKHLQFVSGINPYLYWVTNYLWDSLNFLVPVIGVMIIFFAFNQQAYVGCFRNVLASFLLLFLFGFATIPMMYCFTFVFRIPSLAFISLAVGSLFLGWVSTTTTATLEMLGQDDAELLNINGICMLVFLILPQYCLGRGLLDMKMANYMYLAESYAFGKTNPPNPFNWKFLGRNFLCMFVEGVLAFGLVLFIENYRRNRRKRTTSTMEPAPQDEDDDVKLERQHVIKEAADNAAVKVLNLTKDYGPGFCSCTKHKKVLRAVDNLCVAVERGECFGLLGVNGAGKTTTFKMLTGKTAVTSGDAFFGGYSILNNLDRVRQQIGFCPQFDALNLLLTGREQLTFYARLRGVAEKDIKKVTNSIIARLGLSSYADRTSVTYSGGNKRKLSTAIALIGNPPVILLDEPTTGMDPKARRFLWNRINEIVRDGRSVILTSHSMEECEALCNRMGIMVNGRFQCLGSVQHLKSRFGQGYTLTLKLGGETPKTEEAADLLKARFPEAVLKERHLAQLQYQLPAKGIALSDVFKFVITVQKTLDVEDYSLSQTTLDEVFIAFAKKQREAVEDEATIGCCGRLCNRRKRGKHGDVPLNDHTVTSAYGSAGNMAAGSATAATATPPVAKKGGKSSSRRPSLERASSSDSIAAPPVNKKREN